ncbi:hypothetical protein GCM10023089_18850 [Quisquiliibacterium transsilvanicum]
MVGTDVQMLIMQTPGGLEDAVVLSETCGLREHWLQKQSGGRLVERCGPPGVLGALAKETDEQTEFE